MQNLQMNYFIAFIFLNILFGGALNWKMLKKLKKDHVKTWEDLGKPSLFLNNSIQNNILVFKFLFKKEYISLRDDQLNKICGFLRGFIIFLYVIVIFYLVLGAIFIVSHQKKFGQ